MSDIERITINTPNRQYIWVGIIFWLNYTLDDVSDCRVYCVPCYDLQLQLFIDFNNNRLRKIVFGYPKIRRNFYARLMYAYFWYFVFSCLGCSAKANQVFIY